MDFNTGGGSGRPDDQSRPLYGGEAGGSPSGPPRRPAASAGGEFNYQDPIGSFISTVRSVVLNPVGFFRGIARQGDFINPAIFAVVCIEIAIIAILVVSFIVSLGFGLFSDAQSFGQILVSSLISLVVTPIIMLIVAPISLVISAGIYHLAVILLVKPTNAGFEASFRVVAYSAVAALVLAPLSILNIIPFLGTILFALLGVLVGVYQAVLAVLGMRELHSTTTGRAVLVYLLPVVVFAILGFIFSAIIGYFIAAAFSQ